MRLGCQVEANGVNLQHGVSPKKVERGIMVAQTLEVVACVVPLGLTPVLLFSGIAGLFNVFATRLGRVSDQADALSEKFRGGRDIRLRVLRWRSRALDCAAVLATVAGGLTCGAISYCF
jgi:hypothetical protein